IELDRLRGLREIRNAQDRLAPERAHVREHLAIARPHEVERAATEAAMLAADREHATCPVEERRRIAALRFDVDGLIAVDRIHDEREIQSLRIGARKSGIAIDNIYIGDRNGVRTPLRSPM